MKVSGNRAGGLLWEQEEGRAFLRLYHRQDPAERRLPTHSKIG